jgi:glucose/arabinose dehydrogenase
MQKLLKALVFFLLAGGLLTSCAQQPSGELTLQDSPRNFDIETVVSDLDNPWGMDWLPDGSMLITEKSGTLIHSNEGVKKEVEGVPDIYVRGQGGFLDVALHPEYEQNGWIYFTHVAAEGPGDGGNTKLIRAKFDGNSLYDIQDLYKASPNSRVGRHFGSRIAFDKQGYVYFSIGDRGDRDNNPQDITRDCGKIYRLNDDGSIPADNPFVGEPNAKEAIFSYGHRNPQGLTVHPETGELWSHEHGPKGGDEVNIVRKGENYGWPIISYGVNYSGTKFTDETSRPGMEQPVFYWVPSIAPCGMDFVDSDRYPDWKGHLVVGSLKFNYIELLRLDGNKVIGRERIAEDIGRVRNVKMGPDGFLYVAIEGQAIVRLTPKN